MPAEAVDLVSRLLQYSPTLRFTAVSGRYSFSVDMAFMEIFHVIMKYYYMELKTKYHCSKPFCNLWMRPLDCSYSYIGFYILFQLEACAHPFFDDLRDPNACLPNGRPLPPLFNFGAEGEEWFVFVSLKLLTLWKFLRLLCLFSQNWPVCLLNCWNASSRTMPRSEISDAFYEFCIRVVGCLRECR